MLRFGHPEILWALLAIPVLAGVAIFVHLRRRRALHSFVAASLIDALAPEASTAKWVVKQSLLLLALGSLVVAFSDPQVGTRLEEIKREGIDLYVALDVSLSMKSEDIRPSRLEKAKRDVSELLRKLSGDRVGLIVFAGEAYVQFPLTADYAAADLFISAVDVDAVPVPGTMIGNAITLALKSFSTDAPTQKAIVVVSDGENTEGDVMGAVEDAKKASVRVYSVGMGTPEGGPIPMYNAANVREDYKRDQSGAIVLTKLDESMLQQIATATGGSYHRGTSGGNEIDNIFNELGTLQKVEFGSKQVTGYESRYQYPLGLAIALLLLEVLLSERRTRWVAWLKRLLPAGAAFLAFSLPASLSAQTVGSQIREGNRAYEKGQYGDAEVLYRKALEKDPKSARAQFNVGNTEYKQQRYDEAARSYSGTATIMPDANGNASSFYNLGNTMYRANKYEESIEAYRRALKLNPADDEARYNLMMAREKLKQQQQAKNKQQNQQQQQQQNQQQQQDQKQQQQQQNQQQNQQRQPQNEQARQDRTQQVQKKNQMPKEEAERILEAMKNNEKDLQKQLRKREAVRIRVEKDW